MGNCSPLANRIVPGPELTKKIVEKVITMGLMTKAGLEKVEMAKKMMGLGMF